MYFTIDDFAQSFKLFKLIFLEELCILNIYFRLYFSYYLTVTRDTPKLRLLNAARVICSHSSVALFKVRETAPRNQTAFSRSNPMKSLNQELLKRFPRGARSGPHATARPGLQDSIHRPTFNSILQPILLRVKRP